jgi:predicted transposase/invertase (TIGR01784 family)
MQSESMSGDNALTGYRAIKSRAVYNLCSLHAGQAGRKVRYDELLRSYQMTFCGYTMFPGRKGFVSRYSFRDEEGAELADAVGIIFVELTKVRDVAKKPVQSMTGEEAWGLFFAYASRQKYRGLIGELAAARKEIKMAMEQLQAISKDEIERAHCRSRRMYQMDMDHNLIAAKDEGIAQGRIEGRAESRAEGAKQLAELIKKGYDVDAALKMIKNDGGE